MSAFTKKERIILIQLAIVLLILKNKDKTGIIIDEDIWRKDEDGRAFKFDDKTLEIKAGFGGKFNGSKLKSKKNVAEVTKKDQANKTEQTNKTDKSSTTSQTATASMPQSGHLTGKERFGENTSIKDATKMLASELSENLGREITPKQADQMWDSLTDYTGTSYKKIREAFLDPKNADSKSKRQLKEVDDVIKGSPKWNGGMLYRGINVSDDILASFTPGENIDMKGPSSWSSKQEKAENFTWGEGKKVMFLLPSTKKAASITHLSSMPSEKEVLAPSDAKYRIKSVEKKFQKTSSGKKEVYHHIELEEIE